MNCAIVGMACRFPGAATPAGYWENCRAARVSLQDLHEQRWLHRNFLGGARDRWRTPCRRAGLIAGVDRFAAAHFGISPRRAEVMDPQQRLALALAREALQDAGLETRTFDRARSGVFMGASVSEYGALMGTGARARQLAGGEFGAEADLGMVGRIPPFQAYSMVGSLLNMVASVVAQHFRLEGPAFSLDAACASSLVATVQGMQHLTALPPGELSPVALVGGVYLLLAPENVLGFTRLGALAESECLPYDRRASGFLLGEGAGMLVLKRLADALRDGDRIYAVLRGGACGSNGGDNPTAPDSDAQLALMRRALGELDPEALGYVEGHGTGTPVGDAAELRALGALGTRACLGSAKANLGHLLTAAGMAGLQRAALAVHHGWIPPHAGYAEGDSPLPILSAPRLWTGHRCALVNAFGFGGTNSCVVLEQAPPVDLGPPGFPPCPAPSGRWWFRVGAPSAELLRGHLEELEESLEGRAEAELGPIAHTLSRRAPAAVEIGFAAGSLEELRQALAAGESQPAGGEAAPPVCQLVSLPVSPLERTSHWFMPGARPGPQPPERRRVRLDPSEPRLRDHRLGSRAYLSMAMALELFGFSPLREVRLERPLRLRTATLARLERDGERLTLSHAGQVCFSARLGAAGEPPAVAEAHAPGPLSVAEFYARSFHGPTWQVLTEIRCGEEGVAGTVSGDAVQQLEGALQLGLYWALCRGEGVLPRALDELILREPLGGEPCQVRLAPAGDLVWIRGGQVIGWIRGLRGEPVNPRLWQRAPLAGGPSD